MHVCRYQINSHKPQCALSTLFGTASPDGMLSFVRRAKNLPIKPAYMPALCRPASAGVVGKTLYLNRLFHLPAEYREGVEEEGERRRWRMTTMNGWDVINMACRRCEHVFRQVYFVWNDVRPPSADPSQFCVHCHSNIYMPGPVLVWQPRVFGRAPDQSYCHLAVHAQDLPCVHGAIVGRAATQHSGLEVRHSHLSHVQSQTRSSRRHR